MLGGLFSAYVQLGQIFGFTSACEHSLQSSPRNGGKYDDSFGAPGAAARIQHRTHSPDPVGECHPFQFSLLGKNQVTWSPGTRMDK